MPARKVRPADVRATIREDQAIERPDGTTEVRRGRTRNAPLQSLDPETGEPLYEMDNPRMMKRTMTSQTSVAPDTPMMAATDNTRFGTVRVKQAKLPEPSMLRRARERERMLNGAIDQGAKDLDDAISRRRK